LPVTSVVDALEESKLLRVQGLSRVQVTTGILNSDMGVTNDVATTIEVLGS
jgi:hypothetical protein